MVKKKSRDVNSSLSLLLHRTMTSTRPSSCAVCNTTCSGCQNVHYCGKIHQQQHWPVHKLECGSLRVRKTPRETKHSSAELRSQAPFPSLPIHSASIISLAELMLAAEDELLTFVARHGDSMTGVGQWQTHVALLLCVLFGFGTVCLFNVRIVCSVGLQRANPLFVSVCRCICLAVVLSEAAWFVQARVAWPSTRASFSGVCPPPRHAATSMTIWRA